MMKGGTIVDATIINAPSSTKNAQKARDLEMHQTKKGNEWRFGMKCQFGYRKVAYRGLKKNENRLYAMFACANLYALAIAGRKLSTT